MKKNFLKEIQKRLLAAKHLSFNQAKSLADLMTMDKISDVQKATVLSLLAAKGETSDELAAFAYSLKKKMISIAAPEQTIDVCGTGGDNKSTFNISTASAFVVAASGIPVAKHGNRSITSKCGSADVLEALGANITISPLQAEKILKQLGITFLFAPKYHPAMKNVAKVRTELGFPTIFNYLGPIINPARVKIQLIGTNNLEAAEKIAATLKKLKASRAMVITALDGMDEASLTSPTIVYKLKDGKIDKFQIHPKDYGFTLTSLKHLKGGDVQENALIIKAILNCEIKGPKLDIVLLNSALAISIAKNISMEEALDIAKKTLTSGKASFLLKRFIAMTNK